MTATKRPRASRRGRAANPARGEHTLTLAGEAYLLRPAFSATQAIEDELDASAIALLRKANLCALSYSELGWICAEYIRAGAGDDALLRSISADRIAELIYEEGTSTVFPVVTALLADVVSGGRTTSGEPRAVAGTGSTTTKTT